jgi:lysophospholipase L1-like esterase
VMVNDAQFSVPPATFISNVDLLVQWKRKFYPKTPITLMGGTPLLDNTNETKQVALRQALSDYVTNAADPLVKYYSQANAFDRTVASNYLSNDGIHPNDVSHLLNWNGGYNGNGGLRAWLLTNLPAI